MWWAGKPALRSAEGGTDALPGPGTMGIQAFINTGVSPWRDMDTRKRMTTLCLVAVIVTNLFLLVVCFNDKFNQKQESNHQQKLNLKKLQKEKIQIIQNIKNIQKNTKKAKKI